MGLEQEIRDALNKNFNTTLLEVINESALHAGHSGDDGSGESHWRIVIQSAEFSPMTRLARHRAIYAALGTGIMDRIHALAMEIK